MQIFIEFHYFLFINYSFNQIEGALPSMPRPESPTYCRVNRLRVIQTTTVVGAPQNMISSANSSGEPATQDLYPHDYAGVDSCKLK
jgi:hypothetical protein